MAADWGAQQPMAAGPARCRTTDGRVLHAAQEATPSHQDRQQLGPRLSEGHSRSNAGLPREPG